MIAAGGTGGHVYPALAVAEALCIEYPNTCLYFVGSGGLERDLVRESGIEFKNYDDVRAGPIAGVHLPRRVWSLFNYAIGVVQALLLLGRYRPQVLLLTGGWSGLPVAFAAWLRRVPMMIFLPDIEPGSTIQMLRRLVDQVALTVPESERYFPNTPTIVTGYPLRQAFTAASRTAGRAHFEFEEDRPVLLVFGGSRGARSINQVLLAILPDLLADGIQVLHVTGTLDWPEVAARAAMDGYKPFAYLHHDMGLAQAAADLVVSRAGASTLAEFPLFGLPAILVPYPYAWRYQKVNADYLEDRGAAVRLDDERMAVDLLPQIRAILGDADRLKQMRDCAHAMAQPYGASRLAANLVQLAGGAE